MAVRFDIKNLPKAQHQSQTRSRGDEQPRPRTPGSMDPAAC